MSHISVVIPTLNEGARIERTIASARAALDGPEIVVVDGGSLDATRARAERAGAIVIASPRGRGLQLDRGARHSSGRVVVFLHADTTLPADAGRVLQQALAEPDVVGGAFRFGFDQRVPFVLRQLARGITLRSTVFKTATGDQAIFATRAALQSIGGVPHVPLFEDVRLFGALRRHGRVVILPAAIGTSPRLWQQVGPIRLIGIHLLFRLLHALGVSPARLAGWYPANASG